MQTHVFASDGRQASVSTSEEEGRTDVSVSKEEGQVDISVFDLEKTSVTVSEEGGGTDPDSRTLEGSGRCL